MLPDESELFEVLKFPARGLRAVMVRASNKAWIDAAGSSRGLSGPADLEWLVANRAVADAVLVSAKTAILENYKPIKHRSVYADLRFEAGFRNPAKLIAATNNLANAKKLLDIAAYILTSNPEIKQLSESTVILFQDTWLDAIAKINELGLIRIVTEGGPSLLEGIVREGAVNQFALTTSTFPGLLSDETSEIDAWLAGNTTIWRNHSGGFEFELIGKLPTWEDLLPKHNYMILRKAYTEPAFSVPYEKEPAPGFYVCAACGNRLFEAQKQFNAHCGWPAFWDEAVAGSTKLIEDNSHGMRRTEVVCAACDSHLGHVFYGEGFGFPTDARYCINAGAIERRH
ncbi:MAG: hypothetical protein RL038_1063 [Actinomycetota bacterium]